MAHGQQFSPVPWHQAPLFEIDVDPTLIKERADVIDNELLRYCDEVIREHASLHGWSNKQTNDVRRSLRFIAVLQHTPGAKIYATEVLKLPSLGGKNGNLNAESTLDVLAGAGLLIDDRTSMIERYFITKFAGLPEPMTAQLRAWFEVMVEGSQKPPRRHPRDPMTVRLQIRSITPILRAWASEGHETLTEIGRDDILAALPASGASRHLAEQGLRSLFRVLKSQRAVFVDPTRGMPLTATNHNIPLPLDTAAIRTALNSPDPASALAVALVAFHALAARQLRSLKLTDISDGRLTLDGRVIPLAAPVLPRLSAWLDYRARTWPATINPHLFVNRRTGPRLIPVSRPFPWKNVNLQPQTLREDRILDEVRATGGDLHRICALFGLSVEGAMRYVSTLDHTDAVDDTLGSQTQGSQ